MENETKTEAKEFVRTTIDLPIALNEKLTLAAKLNLRSRHSEMLIALEKVFESPNGNGKKEKAK